MDISKLKESLRGIAVTTVTPFKKELTQVDKQGIETNISYLKKEGVRLIVPCGNTGEFYSLSYSEWKDVVTTTKDAVKSSMTVLAGVGHSLPIVEDQIHHIKETGVDGIMVMYPQHVFVSEEGLLAYYRRILEAAKGIGVVLYKKGGLLTDGVLEKLLDFSNLVAVKYAFGSIVDFSRTVNRLGKGIVWSCGTAERYVPFFWLAGAQGFTSGLGNFAPKISQMMYDSLARGDYNEAMRVQKMITPFEDLRDGREKANNVPMVKAALDHLGLAGGDCRPPIHILNPKERDNAVEAISNWGL